MRVYFKILFFEWKSLIDSSVQCNVNVLIIKFLFLLIDLFSRFVFSFSLLEISKTYLLAEKNMCCLWLKISGFSPPLSLLFLAAPHPYRYTSCKMMTHNKLLVQLVTREFAIAASRSVSIIIVGSKLYVNLIRGYRLFYSTIWVEKS